MTSSMAIRPAKAPYWRGPRTRAATIVKPYVATFMTAIATAMLEPPCVISRRRAPRALEVITPA